MIDGLTPLLAVALGVAAIPQADSSRALARSTPEREGVSSSAVLAFVAAADTEIDALHSFMLVRHGRVIAEGWWEPYAAENSHALFSLSKSFTATAVGLAIAEGKLSLDDAVLQFFLEDAPATPSPNLRAMRVRDLLRMSTGHETEPALWPWDGRGSTTPDVAWTRTFLAHPVPFKPGTRFLYNSSATYVLSAIVQKTTGMTMLDYLRPRLFAPLGIVNPTWESSPEGVTVGAIGLLARTEDIARFGLLYLQRGVWNGRQLVPAAWVEQATGLQTATGSAPASDWDQGYGYQFWRSRHDSYRGDGAFGQYCLVLPERDAVVVITSGVRDMQGVMDLVWERLLPAMAAEPLPDDTAALHALETKLARLAVRVPSGRPIASRATRVSRRWYAFPANERGIRAVALDFRARAPALVVRTAEGETRTPIGVGTWAKSRGGFANGLDRLLSVPANPALATSGAWTSEDVYTLKLVAYETPYHSTLTLRFDGDRLVLDGEHNVGFGRTKLPQLISTTVRQAP